MPDTTRPQHVFCVSEIRDTVLRRLHGYYASLPGAFAYCEEQERTPSTIATARFELFPAPGGRQWLIHCFYGPEDRAPETSDFVISQHEVIPESAAPAVPSAPADRAGLRDCIAGALYRREWPHQQIWRRALATDREVFESMADAVLAVLPAPVDRGAVLREAADAIEADELCNKPAHREHYAKLLRRMADEEQQPETRPARGDQFETWLKAQRDEYEVQSSPQWGALDEALDTYRLHADTGTPLGEHVCEGRTVGDCDCDCLEPPAPLRRSEDDCPGFPEHCPNLLPVDPNPPRHYGGIRCGCADEAVARSGKEA